MPMAPPPDLDTVLVSADDRGVVTVTLDRPDRHNAMDDRLMTDLGAALDHVVAGFEAGTVRAMVLTGAGESFCAGGDLEWMRRQTGLGRAERIAGSATIADLLYRLDRVPVLTIARVNGQAYGGGVGLIAACDIAIACPDARFALTEVSLGLAPSNISPYVVRRMGAANARRTFLNARRMDAAMAHRLGLLSEIADDLDAAVEAELIALLRCGPQAVAATKALIEYVDTHLDTDNRRYTANDLADAWERPEGREGIAAFLENRPPAWRS